MAKVMQPRIDLCSQCKLRLEEFKGAITSGRMSEKEALRNAVRDCDTEDYRFFYPFGFSKHGVIFVAQEEAERARAIRRKRKAREANKL